MSISGDPRIRMLRRFCPLRMLLLFRVHVREPREVLLLRNAALRDKTTVRDIGECCLL